MFAIIDTINAEQLPCAIICKTRRDYYQGNVELIVAHLTDDGQLHGSDFICPDREEANRELVRRVREQYPGIEIRQ